MDHSMFSASSQYPLAKRMQVSPTCNVCCFESSPLLAIDGSTSVAQVVETHCLVLRDLNYTATCSGGCCNTGPSTANVCVCD